jgi:hypothetical protein
MKTKVVTSETKAPDPEEQLQQEHEELDEALAESYGDGPVVVAPIVLTVTRQYMKFGEPDGDEEQLADDTLVVEDFHVPPAEVDVNFKVTKNLGNYESVSVQVGLRVPCYREEAVEAFHHSREFVTKRVQEEIGKAIENAKTRGVKDLF